jgi:hypothetical protein
MARRGIEVVWLRPGPSARREFLSRRLGGGTWVTAYSDVVLRAGRRLVEEGEAEWVPWGELTGRLLNCVGAPAMRLPRLGQALATIERACHELPSDSPFAACARFPGLHRRALAAIDELRDGGVVLREVAALDPRLGALATLEERVLELYEPLGLATWHARAERLLDLAPAPLPLNRLLVFGGASPRWLRAEVLRWVEACGVRVVVALEPGPRAEEAARLLREDVSTPPADTSWYAPVFDGAATASRRDGDVAVELRSMPDPLGECDWTLRRILELTAAGEPRHRIGLLAPDLGTYGPLLASAASRLGVALDMRQPAPLLTNGAARAVLALLEAVAMGDVRRLGRALTVGYFRCNAEVAHSIAGLRSGIAGWRSLIELTPKVPWLSALVAWREEAERDEAPVYRWIERLMALVVSTPLEESFADPASPTRERDLRAVGALQRALNDHAAAAPAAPMRLADFASLCRRLWEEEETVLPGAPSGIAVETDPDGFGELDTLLVVSAVEGVLTPARRQDPILDDALVARVNAARPGMPALANSQMRREDESMRLVRLCATPARRLVLSYPQTSEDRDNVPAFFLQDLEVVLGERARREDLPRSLVTPPRERCLSPSDLAICLALSEPEVPLPPPRLVEESARTLVRIDAEPQTDRNGEEFVEVRDPIRPREIMDAVACGFKAAFQHRLRLRVRRTGETWGNVHRLGRFLELAAVPDLALETDPPPFQPAFERLLQDYPAGRDDWELALLKANALRVYRGLIERERAARKEWAREPESGCRPGPLTAEDGLPRRIGEWRVRLDGRHDGAARIGPYDVIYLFESSMPKRSELEGGRAEVRGKTLWTWLNAIARKQRGRPLALMIDDAVENRRSLLLWPRVPSAELRQVGDLSVFELARHGSDLAAAQGAIALALQRMLDASAEPTPGEWCANCPYGELCRSSKYFGETATDSFLVAVAGGADDDGE